MFTMLKALHFIALLLGAAASFGSVYLMLSSGPHDLAAPGYTNRLRKIYRLTALIALAIFWITGLLMLFGRYGLLLDGFAFNAKIAFVMVLTLSAVFMNLMSPSWARAGGPPPYTKAIHWMNCILLVGAVVLAAFSFN